MPYNSLPATTEASDHEAAYDYAAEAEAPAHELGEISAINLAELQADYITTSVRRGYYEDDAAAKEAIASAEASVDKDVGITVNMTPAALLRFFQQGRQDTFWDHLDEAGSTADMSHASTANNKDFTEDYTERRLTAETALRTFVPAADEHVHPVYGALVGGKERETITGACPEYGQAFIMLTPGENRRAVYSFSDSYASLAETDDGALAFDDSSLLNLEDATRAKAIMNLVTQHNSRFSMLGSLAILENPTDAAEMMSVKDKAGYIEAAVFDEVTPVSVAQVGLHLAEAKDCVEMPELMPFLAARTESVQMHLGEGLGQLSRDWTKRHFPDATHPPSEPAVNPEPNPLWEKLGLSPDSGYDDVARALADASAARWKQLAMSAGYDFHARRQPIPQDPGANTHFMNRFGRNLWMAGPAKQEAGQELIAIEEERRFFRLSAGREDD